MDWGLGIKPVPTAAKNYVSRHSHCFHLQRLNSPFFALGPSSPAARTTSLPGHCVRREAACCHCPDSRPREAQRPGCHRSWSPPVEGHISLPGVSKLMCQIARKCLSSCSSFTLVNVLKKCNPCLKHSMLGISVLSSPLQVILPALKAEPACSVSQLPMGGPPSHGPQVIPFSVPRNNSPYPTVTQVESAVPLHPVYAALSIQQKNLV